MMELQAKIVEHDEAAYHKIMSICENKGGVHYG